MNQLDTLAENLDAAMTRLEQAVEKKIQQGPAEASVSSETVDTLVAERDALISERDQLQQENALRKQDAAGLTQRLTAAIQRLDAVLVEEKEAS